MCTVGPRGLGQARGAAQLQVARGYVNGALRIGQGTTCACVVLSRDNFSLKLASRSSPCPLPISVCICLCVFISVCLSSISPSLWMSLYMQNSLCFFLY